MAFTLERYVFRQIAAAFALAVFAMTGILLVGMAAVMVREGYSIVHARTVWKCLLLSSFPYAAPVALMCSVTLVFGRMSGDNELSAAASSGVRPERLAAPAWLLGAAVACASFWMNHWVLPLAQRDLFHAQERFLRMMILDMGGTIKEARFWPYRICVEDTDAATGDWVNVAVFETPGSRVQRLMRASRGRCRVDDRTMTARLEMDDCLVLQPDEGGISLGKMDAWLKAGGHPGKGLTVAGPMAISLDLDLSSRRRRNMDSPKLLTLPELRAELLGLVGRLQGMTWLARPLSVCRDLSGHRGAIEGRLSALRAEHAQSEGDLGEARRKEDGAGNALDGALRRLDEVRSWPRSEEDPVRTALDHAERTVAEARQTLARCRARATAAGEKFAGSHRALVAMESEKRRVTERWAEAAAQAKLLAAQVEFHRRNANAATCFALVAAAMPLGVMARRGSVIYAVAASLGVVLLVHYPLDMLGQVLAWDGWISPVWAGWTPTVVVGALAAALHGLAWRR